MKTKGSTDINVGLRLAALSKVLANDDLSSRDVARMFKVSEKTGRLYLAKARRIQDATDDMVRFIQVRCWECGTPAPGGVCLERHDDYSARDARMRGDVTRCKQI